MTTVVDTPVDTGRQVTILTAQGLSSRQIAAQLGVSQRTVTRWRSRHIVIDEPLPTEWKNEAACRGVDPTWFAPAEDALTQYPRGRAVCMRCPVRDACLTDAMNREGDKPASHRAGLWGGLSPEQRAALARARTPRTGLLPSRTEEIQARHRDELLASLRETA